MTRDIWAARFVVFVAFLDLFIQFPVVAPFARSLGATPLLVGVIVGAYSATNLVGNLLAGMVLDRWGRPGPLLVGLIVSAVALAAYAWVATVEQLLFVRAVHGLATAVLTPGAFALLGDAAAVDRRARVMGVSGAIIAIAAVTGPPLGGLTRDRLGFAAVFIGGALLMVAAAALFAAIVRPRLSQRRSAGEDGSRSGQTGRAGHEHPARVPGSVAHNARPAWLSSALSAAYSAVLALTIGLGTLITHLPLLLEALGESAARSGLAFTVYALVAMVVMAGPANRLSDRRDRYGPLATGLVLIGLGLLCLAIATGFGGIILGMAIFGLGFGLLFPAATALVTDATGPSERGLAFGIFYAIYSFGVVLGSLVSGLSEQWLDSLNAAPFLIGGLVALIVVPVIVVLGRRGARPSQPAIELP